MQEQAQAQQQETPTSDSIHQQQQQQADRVYIVYYTDPLCCWSWAMEPQWRKLLYTFRDNISYRYCMGGLIADWNNYKDTMNAVSRPVQMGPIWVEAHHISGMPLFDRVWINDPPASSYPACVAVKCAQKQSSQAGEIYLRALREALMLRGLNIAKKESLLQVAQTLKNVINVDEFEDDLLSGNCVGAFKKDIEEVNFRNITRFPTLTISYKKQGVMVVGYRPYNILSEAFQKVAPHLTQTQPVSTEEYKNYWPTLTERELKEVAN